MAVPPLVARNLYGDGVASPPEGATVTVTYRKLPKGARQPSSIACAPCNAACLAMQGTILSHALM